jgi:hypothetical protein
MSNLFPLTVEDWHEMNSLRKAISHYPATVAPEKMERFAKLFVKSLQGADDSPPIKQDEIICEPEPT